MRKYLDTRVLTSIHLTSDRGDDDPNRKDHHEAHDVALARTLVVGNTATSGPELANQPPSRVSANDFNLFEVLAVEQGFPGYYFNKDDTQVIVDDPKMVEAVNVLRPS